MIHPDHISFWKENQGNAMISKLDQALQFHQTALAVRGQRQQLLASNIANADTPHYKARDVDFGKAMDVALAGKGVQAAPALVKTAGNHLEALPSNGPARQGPGGAALQYRTIAQGNIDGNTVDMDVERNQFADNAIRYEASLTLINGQIRNLLAAIQG